MSYASTVLGDSPKLFFRLGDPSGTTMTDSSGGSHNGTYTNSPTLGVTGLLTGDADTAVTFAAGSSQYGEVSAQTSGGGTGVAFSYECWVKGSSMPTTSHILIESATSSGNQFCRLFVDASGHVNFTGRDNTGGSSFSVIGSVNVNDGNRHHIVATKTTGNLYTLYIDGTSSGTPVTTSIGTQTLNTTTIAASSLAGAHANFFTGTIDEVSTYTTALNSTQVTAHYNAGITSSPGSMSVTQTQTPTLLVHPSKTPEPINVTQTQTPTLTKAASFLRTLSATQTQTPTLTKRNIRPISLTVTQTQTPTLDPLPGIQTVASGDESNPTWAIKVTDMRGTVAATLTNAEMDKVTWTLNAPDTFAFHFPKNAYSAAQIPILGGSEIQVYRNGDLLTWGPVIGMQSRGQDGKIDASGVGVDWYLNRRFIDGPILNMLTNPDFESGTTGWSSTNVTFTQDSTYFYVGAHSAKLVSATAGGDCKIFQTVAPSPNGIGKLVTASAWMWIDSFTAPAFGWLGLLMEGFDATGAARGNNYFPVEWATPRRQWYRAHTTMWVPPNESWTFRISLWAPQGTIYWDDVKVVATDSLSTAGLTGSVNTPVDIAKIVEYIVSFLQSTSAGKSALNIGTRPTTTGITMSKHYFYYDHTQFDAALREYMDRSDGIDYSVDYTPNTRIYHTYAHKRGVDRHASVTLRYNPSSPSTSNCTDYRVSDDAGQTITRSIILGSDNGPDREQGEAVDASQVGGVILQDVRQAPQGSKAVVLQPMANERIARYKSVVHAIDMDLQGSSGLIPTINCGDLVNVVINDGYINISGTYRIQAMSLDCPHNILTVTVALDDLS